VVRSLAESDVRHFLLAATVVACALLCIVPNSAAAIPAGAAGSPGGVVAAATGPTTANLARVLLSPAADWPELHDNPQLSGYDPNASLSTTNASQFGVAWDLDTDASILDSPAIAYDPLLGETIAYIGNDGGDVLAVDLASGAVIWSDWLGSPIRSSPLVNNGSVYVGTYSNPTIFRLNATTGGTECSYFATGGLEGSPTFATPPGGVPTLYFPAEAPAPRSGPMLAINAQTCQLEWSFDHYNQEAGIWASASYAVNAQGIPMVVWGTDDPDSAIYAVNALNGSLLWRFQCYNPPGTDFDVGAGVAISPPGRNGLPQGVAYVTNKAARAYALDLNNGTLLWEVNLNAVAGSAGVARSTPALDGNSVVLGYAQGLFNLNGRNGSVDWIYNDSTNTESIASPAIAGGHGHAIALTDDVGGNFDVVSMKTGKGLFSYPTGGYVTSSPAVSGGNVVLGSSNGFLYDFVVGGGDASVLPTTNISSPVDKSTIPNPNGPLTVYGNASDPSGIGAVEVAIQSGGPTGPWWDAATGTWAAGIVQNPALLAAPGATATAWTFAVPVPGAGGAYRLTADASSIAGQADLHAPQVGFTVAFTTVGPHLEVNAPYVAPGGNLTVTGGGFGGSTKVTVTLAGKTVAKVTTLANGTLPATRVGIASSAPFGLTAFTANAKKGNLSATASFTIANSWSQLGDGPGHVGSEPNDAVLNDLIYPGDDQWAVLAWQFDPVAAINASPAVLDGVVYVADSVGNLYALDDHNGGLIWNFTLATGAAVDGSPAVDPTDGLVLFGANDGSLDAVNLGNGTLAWTDAVGGDVHAPVYAGGAVYVSSSSGTISEVTAATGAVAWTQTLPSAVGGAPSFDTTAQLLVIGESNGDVVALNSSTGTTVWTYTTGGPVTASAVVTGGTAYIGSGDGNVYALAAGTGAVRWTFTTNGPVADTGSVYSNSLLFIGSSTGRLYAIHISTGKLDFDLSVSGGVVGVATTHGVVVYETTAGVLGANRAFKNEQSWTYATPGGLATAPAIVDGAIYVAAADGFLYAFTGTGAPPV
jgi:outer membrane protein assembly factor BamB